jgi:YgiT-type zinc finger domain-containing protein
MKCVICHSEDIAIRTVKEEIARGSDLVLVPVRVPICLSCGERYYDRRTVRFLETLRAAVPSPSTLREVGKIFEYPDTAQVAKAVADSASNEYNNTSL